MKAHEDRLDELNENAKQIQNNLDKPEELERDMEHLTNRWTSTFSKISEYKLIIEYFVGV